MIIYVDVNVEVWIVNNVNTDVHPLHCTGRRGWRGRAACECCLFKDELHFTAPHTHLSQCRCCLGAHHSDILCKCDSDYCWAADSDFLYLWINAAGQTVNYEAGVGVPVTAWCGSHWPQVGARAGCWLLVSPSPVFSWRGESSCTSSSCPDWRHSSFLAVSQRD